MDSETEFRKRHRWASLCRLASLVVWIAVLIALAGSLQTGGGPLDPVVIAAGIALCLTLAAIMLERS